MVDVEAVVQLLAYVFFTLLREVHWRSLGPVPRRQNSELLASFTVTYFYRVEHDLTMMSISSAPRS